MVFELLEKTISTFSGVAAGAEGDVLTTGAEGGARGAISGFAAIAAGALLPACPARCTGGAPKLS